MTLVLATAAQAEPSREKVHGQMLKSQQVVRFWENKGQWIRAPRKENCRQVPWRQSCVVARASYRMHTRILRATKRRLWHMLPAPNDWTTALKVAQRPYPGTFDRAMRIADHEGGRGPWVWWGGSCADSPCLWRGRHIGYDATGDTVGGWVQFRYSTFIVYWPAVVRDLHRRGFRIPDLGWARPTVVAGASDGYGPWLSPLGQALTVSYMHYYGKQGSHWPF